MRRNQPGRLLADLLLDAVRRKQYLVVFLVVAVVAAVLLMQHGCPRTPPAGSGTPGWDEREDTTPEPTHGPGEYLFCFWNVENLFDDHDDGRKTKADAPFDTWFAHNPAVLQAKLDHLCDVLLPLGGGRGPDILAVAEIESQRAVDLLRHALNRRLADPNLRYRHLAYRDPAGGRNIAPAVVSRLPLDPGRTRLLDPRMRILETQAVAAGKPLVILASHWTSRISDPVNDGKRRAAYGDRLYGRFRQMATANPRVDLLICGDFNDNPDDASVVRHLRATGDLQEVGVGADPPMLFNPFARLWRDGEASHYYGTKPYLFDQVVVSPGMLDDEGWSCDVASARVVKQMATRQGRPNRFGGAGDKRPLEARGASDHFPVTVQLRVR